MKKIGLIAFLSLAVFTLNAQLVISEVVSSSTISISDDVDSTPDWIEIYNSSSEEVNLEGWVLSDNDISEYTQEELVGLWKFPNLIIAPNSYTVVLAAGDEFEDGIEFPQANFKLKKEGEEVFLYNEGLVLIDQLEFDCIPTNRSFGINSNSEYSLLYVPTPGNSNNTSPVFDLDEDQVILSHLPGLYENAVQLEVRSDLGKDIYFTTDGTEPSEESEKVIGMMSLTEKTNSSGISYIPTAVDWVEPKEEVFNGYTYKFMTFDQSCPSSKVEHADYFIRPDIHERYPVPVVSITFEDDDLFGDDGIMVSGSTGNNYLGKGDDWERRGHFQFFDKEHNPILSQPIDMRIRGRGSRKNRQKSLRLYARDENGKSNFNYPFFPDRDLSTYRRLALRSGHSDFTQTMIKDLLSSEMVENVNVDYMESETSVVFLNGEYWGIQNLRENLDKYYIESHYGANPDSVTILKFEVDNLLASEGSSDDFVELLAFADANDLGKQENYDHVANKIDISNFIDYFATELYFGNWDWPQNNQRVWKSNADSSKYRWMFYDCDGCFYRYSLDRITSLDNPQAEVLYSISLLKNLLANPSFRTRFHARYVELVSETYSSERMISKIDSLEQYYEPLIIDHMNRWSTPSSYYRWKENLEEMRVFALQRPSYAMAQLDRLFGSPFMLYPNPSTQFIKVDNGTDSKFNVIIRNTNGKLMSEGMYYSSEEISTEALNPGVYLITVTTGHYRHTERFVKM